MIHRRIVGAFAAAGFLLGGVTASFAQGDGPGVTWDDTANTRFLGHANAMGPNCPPMDIHVVPKGKNELQGVAWGMGEGGMSIYTVTGTLAANGVVVMDLKPVGSSGTASKIEGSFKQGMLMAKMGAGTCHAGGAMLMMPIVLPTNRVGGGGG